MLSSQDTTVPINYIIVGALACVMASAGVYGMFNSHIIPPNSDASNGSYSSQLSSLNTQVNSLNSQVDSLNSQVGSLRTEMSHVSADVNSINGNLTSLGVIRTNISDIHEKLAALSNLDTNVADIQSKLSNIANTTTQLYAPTPTKLLITLDKSTYLPGQTVHISGMGAEPLKAVQVQLLDSNGFALTGQTTWADSSGSILYGLQLSSSVLPGQYQVKIISDQTSALQSITIGSTASTSSSYTLTAQTDKGIYQGGDIIEVTGMAAQSSSVTAVLKSPSGTTFNSGTTSNSDGSYTIVFTTSQTFEAGTWTITVTNLSQSRATSVYIQSAGTQGSSSGAFTAQTDKTSYQPGDLIRITGTAQASSTVTAVLSSPSQATYSSSTTVNSDGTYAIIFSTTTSYQTGNWNVNVSNLGQSKTIYFTIGTGTSSSGTASPSSHPFTAQTDKTSYQQGDMVQVAGNAQPGSTVNATMVSPSGTSYNTSTITNSNGNYVMFFSTTGSYPTGSWYVEVSNNGQTKILSFTMSPS